MIIRRIFFLALILILGTGFFLSWEVFLKSNGTSPVQFDIHDGDTAAVLAARLQQEHIISHSTFFLWTLKALHRDRSLKVGTVAVDPPITLWRVVEAIKYPSEAEKTVTIIPGWDLRDLAASLESTSVTSTANFYHLVGNPGVILSNSPVSADFVARHPILNDKPSSVSLEGYLAPETYRVFADSAASDLVDKAVSERESQFTSDLRAEIARQGHTIRQVLTLASIVEKEAQSKDDRAKVADIFWRRLKNGWPLQSDATVLYAVGKKGTLFTTAADRKSKNLWNTYVHTGLPPGPMSNPSLESIVATIYPEKNPYWFFLTTTDGQMYYAKTSEEHAANVAKYLR